MHNNQTIADKFNRIKTSQKDNLNFSNIYNKKINAIPLIKPNINTTTKNLYNQNNNLYNFFKPQTKGLLNNLREIHNITSTKYMPKIEYKERPIPPYQQYEHLNLNKKSISSIEHINMNFITKNIADDEVILEELIQPPSQIIYNELNKATIKCSDTIAMNITTKNKTDDNIDVYSLKTKHIHNIIHIYQEKYVYRFPTGLGDFIRSCFFIIQFCKQNSFNYEIAINHPIALCLKNYANKYVQNSKTSIMLNNSVSMFPDANWDSTIFDSNSYITNFKLRDISIQQYVNYLNGLQVVNNSVFSYNIFFPYYKITSDETNTLSKIFEPTDKMNELINVTLNNMNFAKKKYNIIHIRSGDTYLKQNSSNYHLNDEYINVMTNEIGNIILKNPNIKWLLISDNNEIKQIIHKLYPNIHLINFKITHLGDGELLDYESVQNTMLDFFLMAYSAFIYSFTVYSHGSGFSYWCSKIYNIPYKCKYIQTQNENK